MLLSYYNTKDKPHLLLIATRNNVHPQMTILCYHISTQASLWQWFIILCFIYEKPLLHWDLSINMGQIQIKHLWQYRMLYSWRSPSRNICSDTINTVQKLNLQTWIPILVLYSVKGSRCLRLHHEIYLNIFSTPDYGPAMNKELCIPNSLNILGQLLSLPLRSAGLNLRYSFRIQFWLKRICVCTRSIL